MNIKINPALILTSPILGNLFFKYVSPAQFNRLL